jgi:uncharacterized membrane protein YhhN
VTAFVLLVAVAGVAALVDWTAVWRDDARLEYVAKPAVLAALTLAAVALPAASTDLGDRRWWFVAALAASLVGDVLLMLPSDRFVPGLVAFLAGHVLYIVGLLQPPSAGAFAFSGAGIATAAVCVAAVGAWPATLIFRSLVRTGQRPLVVPVAVYLVAICTMVVLATNVGVPAAAAGAVLFLASDTILALQRFVRPVPRGDVAVHVTYHLAQILLVLSLLG